MSERPIPSEAPPLAQLPSVPKLEDAERPLSERLVEAALEILAREGLAALTLRRVARQAGVSHAAPARHFRSLADLLASVAARGFELLSSAIVSADEVLPSAATAAERLDAAGRAYCACAVEHPALFSLMFRNADLDLSNEEFVASSATAFDHLVTRVRAAQEEGWQPQREARELAGACWSVIHGLATLWAHGSLQRALPGASLEELMQTTFGVWMNRPSGPSVSGSGPAPWNGDDR